MSRLRLGLKTLAQCTAPMLFIVVIWSVVSSVLGEASMGNQIHVIAPYRQASTWVFDDSSVGLKAEPFVSGIPQMIDALVKDILAPIMGFGCSSRPRRSPDIKSSSHACDLNTAAIGTVGLLRTWKGGCVLPSQNISPSRLPRFTRVPKGSDAAGSIRLLLRDTGLAVMPW